MLEIVQDLLNSWHERDVLYCHWKSNDAVERGLNGDGDLDVLVSEKDTGKTYQSLTDLGFKRLQEPPGAGYPGIEHWLGLSGKEGKLVHLHLHFRLVYGEKFIKGHRYADEEGILARRILSKGIYQTNPADELVFLFIRTILKVDFIWVAKRIAGLEKQYFPKHILAEYAFLSDDLSEQELREACQRFLPGIDATETQAGIDSIHNFDLLKLWTWRRKLRADLAFSKRLSPLQGWKAFFRVYTLFFLRKFGLFKKPKKQLYCGGRTIALLGADGAGKSTMMGELNKWLGYYLDVDTLYGGTGDGKKDPLLSLFDMVMLAVGGIRKKPKAERKENFGEKGDGKKTGLKVQLKNVRALLITRHRLATVKKAHRLCHNGKIILLDRFPQPFQRQFGDGPKAVSAKGMDSRLYAWEQHAYNRMFDNFPDYCFILMVDPEVSVTRKPENIAEIIVAKNKVLTEIAARKENQTVILDANMEYEEVLNQLKRHVWDML